MPIHSQLAVNYESKPGVAHWEVYPSKEWIWCLWNEPGPEPSRWGLNYSIGQWNMHGTRAAGQLSSYAVLPICSNPDLAQPLLKMCDSGLDPAKHLNTITVPLTQQILRVFAGLGLSSPWSLRPNLVPSFADADALWVGIRIGARPRSKGLYLGM